METDWLNDGYELQDLVFSDCTVHRFVINYVQKTMKLNIGYYLGFLLTEDLVDISWTLPEFSFI